MIAVIDGIKVEKALRTGTEWTNGHCDQWTVCMVGGVAIEDKLASTGNECPDLRDFDLMIKVRSQYSSIYILPIVAQTIAWQQKAISWFANATVSK